VFGIVFLQLLLTACTSVFLTTSPYAESLLNVLLMKEGLPLIAIAFAGLGCLLWMQQIVLASRGVISSTSFSPNELLVKKYALLALFSLSQSLLVGVFTLAYPLRTLLVGSAHTLFALAAVVLYSVFPSSLRVDLTARTAGLIAATSSLLIGGLANVFLGSPLLDQLLLGFGAVLFVAYMAYDVQRIIGTDTSLMDSSTSRSFKEGDAALAAANLYLSIIGFFMRIVEIIDRFEGKRGR
jgi:FtsH-binding integral membrane protein